MQVALKNIGRAVLRFQNVSRTAAPVVGGYVRQLSTPANSKKTAQTLPETTPAEPKIEYINDEMALAAIENPKSIGLFFHNLQYISRKENSMGSENKPVKYLTNSNLMKLFSMVKTPQDGKYVVKLTDYYQTKGLDFNEVLAVKFVETSIVGEQAKAAAEHCAKYKNRMGAWLTPEPLEELVKILCSTNDFELAVKMVGTVSVKGVIALPSTFDLLLTKALEEDEKSYEFHKTLMLAAQKMVSEDDWKSLTNKFPAPPEPIVAVAEPEVAAENP